MTFLALPLFAFFVASTSFGQTIPSFSIEKMKHAEKATVEFSGEKKPTVIFLWASWCEFCKEFSAELRPFYGKNKDRIRLIGISVDEKKSDAQKAAKDSYSYIKSQYWGSKEVLQNNFHVHFNQIPLVILLNKDGTIDTVYEGSQSDKVNYFKKRVRYMLNDELEG